MGIAISVVDAFASHAFAGNPAAVCVLDGPADETWMQHVAAEMNLSETAFLVARGGHWDLRWFTPTVEVPLCGHATLASAHHLWESGRLPDRDAAVFHTRRSGVLTCRRDSDWIHMDFPARRAVAAPPPAGMAEALGASLRWVGLNGDDYLAELADAATVRTLAPDHAALAALPVGGVIVTAMGDAGFDFVSRYFAPAYGIVEDPVTGAAHCVLAPFWGERLGKASMRGWQASRRGGEVRVAPSGERVRLSGQAVTNWRGEFA